MTSPNNKPLRPVKRGEVVAVKTHHVQHYNMIGGARPPRRYETWRLAVVTSVSRDGWAREVRFPCDVVARALKHLHGMPQVITIGEPNHTSALALFERMDRGVPVEWESVDTLRGDILAAGKAV